MMTMMMMKPVNGRQGYLEVFVPHTVVDAKYLGEPIQAKIIFS